jgi:DNA-binding response OmpR family regulator
MSETLPIPKPPVVAIINTAPDIVEMLRIAFELAGIVAVSTYAHQIRSGGIDIEAFMRLHDPDVVLYDIAPPYENNWLLFQHVVNLPAFSGRPIVLTTTNESHLADLAEGSGLRIFEIVGTPYNISELVDEVQLAMNSRRKR